MKEESSLKNKAVIILGSTGLIGKILLMDSCNQELKLSVQI